MLLLRLWFVSPMRCLVKAGQQLTMFLRGLYTPVQISVTTVRTRQPEQSLSARSLHIDRCFFPRSCRRPHHHVYRPGLPSELAPYTHRLWAISSHEAAPHSYDPLARDELWLVQEDGDLCASARRLYKRKMLRMLTSSPVRSAPSRRPGKRWLSSTPTNTSTFSRASRPISSNRQRKEPAGPRWLDLRGR